MSDGKRRINTLVLFGTRPEVIKLAPVVKELEKSPNLFNVKTCFTAQHRDVCEPFLEFFEITPDFDLNVMIENQSINDVTIRILERLSGVMDEFDPELIIVQGDTTSAFAAALLGFYRKIIVCHVEAGLRSHDRKKPFPEEMNRVLISRLSDIHFAPTKNAKEALIAEGIDESSVFVTGNTVIDSLKYAIEILDGKNGTNGKRREASTARSVLEIWKEHSRRMKKKEANSGSEYTRAVENKTGREHHHTTRAEAEDLPAKGPQENKTGNEPKLVLVTTHRRESISRGIIEICRAVNEIVKRHGDVFVLFPMHANPAVENLAKKTIVESERVKITRQLEYLEMIEAVRESFIVMTDSGGLQEEVPYIGKPLIILRDVTERNEIVENGRAVLGGTESRSIVDAFESIYGDRDRYESMSRRSAIYGDGKASQRIVEAIHSVIDRENRF